MSTKKQARFKLAEMASAPAELELIHPVAEFNDPETGKTGYVVTIAGPHSRQYRDALLKYQDSEKTEKDAEDLVSSVFVGWNDAFEEEFSKEAVIRFVSDDGNRWARIQISEFAVDPANFYKKK